MQRKYINTIPVLLSNDKIKTLSFSLIRDTDILKTYKTQYKLMDEECINEYNEMINNYNENKEVVKTNKWWNNLNYILKQCEIYNIDVVITIYDFNEKSMFKGNYSTNDWDDNIQGKFLKDLCNFVNYHINDDGDIIYGSGGKPEKRYCKCILNFGYGCYKNPNDINNEISVIYPMSGYLRDMIMHMAYDYGFTSNMMSLTANESGNIYYYNPYSEWKSYDDNMLHSLLEYEIVTRDFVDGQSNGMAQSVVYDESAKPSGGYCGFLINCNNKSIPLMTMYDMSYLMEELKYDDEEGNKISVVNHYTNNGIINPTIMNEIFNPSSRKCLRYFNNNSNYFTSSSLVRFDDNGEVIV